jgi:hypothetical protein
MQGGTPWAKYACAGVVVMHINSCIEGVWSNVSLNSCTCLCDWLPACAIIPTDQLSGRLEHCGTIHGSVLFNVMSWDPRSDAIGFIERKASGFYWKESISPVLISRTTG